MELKIAGNQVERSLMMPLLYIENDKDKADIEKDMKDILESFIKGNPNAPRMKPLDVVKVLMGIRSDRDSVKQCQNDGKFWAKLHEYDYEQLTNLADKTVQ